MSSYAKGKENDEIAQLQEQYRLMMERHVGIRQFVIDEYNLLNHYMPGVVGLSAIAVVGGLAVAWYNNFNKRSFEDIYLASW